MLLGEEVSAVSAALLSALGRDEPEAQDRCEARHRARRRGLQRYRDSNLHRTP